MQKHKYRHKDAIICECMYASLLVSLFGKGNTLEDNFAGRNLLGKQQLKLVCGPLLLHTSHPTRGEERRQSNFKEIAYKGTL